MQKYLYLFLVLVLIYSCKRHTSTVKDQSASKRSDTIKATTAAVKFNNPTLTEYKEFVSSLNSNDMTTSTKAAEKFKTLFKGQSTSTCDTAFTFFSDYYDLLSNNLTELQQKNVALDIERYFIRYDKDTAVKLPVKIKVYVDHLAENGFHVGVSEGGTYVGQNRDFLGKWFYGMVSPTMKKFLIQLNEEDKKIWTDDASILISPTELVDRTIWWEDFVKENPDFISSKTARTIASDYLEYLFKGTENTRVLEIDSNKLSPFFTKAYDYVENRYPTSEAAKKIASYHRLLLSGKKSSVDSLLKLYFNSGSQE